MFKPEIEYIKQISGFVSELQVSTGRGAEKRDLTTITIIASLCIHTNLKSHGPLGEEKGTPFSSDEGSRIIGFYGKAGSCLDSLGVVTIPDI